MPFPVSISFSSSSFPYRTEDMPPSSFSPQKQRQNPATSTRTRRPRPLGLLKARRAMQSQAPLGALGEQRQFAGIDSGDRDFYLGGTTMRASPLVTKQHQQHHPQASLSAIPQSISSFDNVDLANQTTYSSFMASSSSTSSFHDHPSASRFGHQDWLDLRRLFSNACSLYLETRSVETIKALRDVLSECHRFLLSFDDPSILFAAQSRPSDLKNQQQSRIPAGAESFIQKIRETPSALTELPTAFYTLLGTTLLFFGNCISSHPEHAEPGEFSSGIPYWIAALDTFETGENSPSRFFGNTSTLSYGSGVFWDRVVSPREDWLMAIMWGRALVALADAMLERNKLNPPPPPKPQYFPSPFPVNTDYLKTGTLWDEEPEWPSDSPVSIIIARRPPISRRMALADATADDILQQARDHISRGMFHMPRHAGSPFLPSDSEHPAASLFTRTRVLYDTAYPILLAAEQLNDYDERKEWFSYAESIFSQIKLAHPRPDTQVHERAARLPSPSQEARNVVESISDGEIETVHGRAWVLIGSSIAEDLEGTMEEDSDDEPSQITPLRRNKAAEARQALERGIELVQSAISRIKDEPLPTGEEEDVEIAYEYETSGENDFTFTSQEIESGEESEDDGQPQEGNMSARVREKQPAEPDTEVSHTTRSEEQQRISRLAARLRRQQETEIEKAERIRLLEEGYVSLANVAYLTRNKEEEDKYLRLAEIVRGAGIDEDEDMEEAN